MDMSKYSGLHFIKCDDVRDGPIVEKIAGVKEGKFAKPDLYFRNGDVFSLNATNNKTLLKAYGKESDAWIAKTIRLRLGEAKFQGEAREAVIVEPVSPPIEESDGEPAPAPIPPPLDDEIPF